MNWDKHIAEVLNNPTIGFREGHAILIKQQTTMLKEFFKTMYDGTHAKKLGYSMESTGLSYADVLKALENYEENDQMV